MTTGNNNLDLSSNATDDAIPYGTNTAASSTTAAAARARRTKRGAPSTGSCSDAITTTGLPSLTPTIQTTNIIALPLLLFFHVLSLFYQFVSTILPEPITRPITNLMNIDSESDKLLTEIPKQQSELQTDASIVGRDQAKLRKDMDSLRERIRKIEERRERWSTAAGSIDKEREEKARRKEDSSTPVTTDGSARKRDE